MIDIDRFFEESVRAIGSGVLGPVIGFVQTRMNQSADVDRLPVKRVIRPRILEAGNGATVDDVGKFWFTPGYSQVGGPDIVREE